MLNSERDYIESVIEDRMDEVLSHLDLILPNHQITGRDVPVALPASANIIDPSGEFVLNKPQTTDTERGSFFDLAVIKAVRKAQEIEGGARLTDYTLVSSVEPNPLAAMVAWQTGIKTTAYAAPISNFPHLFRNASSGISELNQKDFWPYEFDLFPNTQWERGVQQLHGFHRIEGSGFKYQPDVQPFPLKPEQIELVERNEAVHHDDLLQVAVRSLRRQREITEAMITTHKQADVRFVGDLPVVAAAIDLETGEQTSWHPTTDQHDGDSTQHAEVKATLAAERQFGKARFEELTLVTTLEPCAMCTITAHQAGYRNIVFGVQTETVRNIKPELFGSHKKAMIELSKQPHWPFKVPFEQADTFQRDIIAEMTTWGRTQSGDYYPLPT